MQNTFNPFDRTMVLSCTQYFIFSNHCHPVLTPTMGPDDLWKAKDFSSLRQLQAVREASLWTEKTLHFSQHLGKHQKLNWRTRRPGWIIPYSLSRTAAFEATDGISSFLVWGNLENLTNTDIRICCICTTFANSELNLGRQGSSVCGSFFWLHLHQPESEGHLSGSLPRNFLKPSLP